MAGIIGKHCNRESLNNVKRIETTLNLEICIKSLVINYKYF